MAQYRHQAQDQGRQVRRRDDLDPGTPQRILHLARFVEAARPRDLSEAHRARRHLDGKLEARHLPEMGPRRRRDVEGQSEAGDHSRLGIRAERRSRLRPSRVVRRRRAGRRRHDEPDRLSRSDSADARRAVDRRLHHRAVHDVVVARRPDLRAHDRQGSVDRCRAVRGDSQNAGRHDGRILPERHRARAFGKSRAGLPAARHVSRRATDGS